MDAAELPPADQLTALIDADHERIIAALDDPSSPPMDVVIWAATHLATVERVLYPFAARRLRPRSGVPALRRQAVELERLVRALEQHHAGDALAAGVSSRLVREQLRELVGEHAEEERQLVSRLVRQLTPAAEEALAADYQRHLEHAPTRPHPHVPHRGFLGLVAFRVDALRDRILDTMDARHVPAPRPRPRRVEPGRWGQYLLGGLRDH
jgi:hypothetical protein